MRYLSVTSVLLLLALLLPSTSALAQAQVCFTSDASATAYDDGWDDGDNDGTGFGPWSLLTTSGDVNRNGHFRGNSTLNGDGVDDNGDGDINTAGDYAWGLYANEGNQAAATRTLSTPVGDGSSFSLAFDNGYLDDGGIYLFELNGPGGPLMSFAIFGGAPEYLFADAAPVRSTGVPVTEEGLEITIDVGAAGAYTMTITRLEDGTSTVVTGTFLSDTVIDGVIFGNVNAGPDPPRDLFVNSLEACYPDTTPPVCRIEAVNQGPPKNIDVFIEDAGSGVASVKVLKNKNATVEIPKGSGNFFNQGDVANFGPPETNAFLMNAEKINQSKGANIVIEVTDAAGNKTRCDPILETLTAEVPEGFELSNNYPNPFNPETIIPFGLPESSHARLVVYDVMGREVVTLVDESLSAGTYEASWDGRTAQGQVVPSGVYLYRLEAGAFVQVRRMTLIK